MVEKKVEPKKDATQKALSNKPLAATSIKTGSEKLKKAPVKKESVSHVSSGKKAQEKAPAQKVASEKKQEVVKKAGVEKQVEKALTDALPEVEKIMISEQKAAEVVAEKQEEVAQEIQAQPIQDIQKDVANLQESVLPPIDMSDVTFVGVQDLEHLQLHQIVSGQLAKYWKRPVGMEKKMCVIKIELDATGKIVNIFVEKGSGVPMYDMAAKAAAVKPVYPREIWNKKLVIQF